MKRAVSSLALTLLLCACAPSASPPTSTESPAASTPESAAVESPGTATPEQAAALPAGLEPTGGDVLDYEEIRPIAIFSDQSPMQGYYTMRQGEHWGLLRNDGQELLPCVYDSPVNGCFLGTDDDPAWHVERSEPAPDSDRELDAQLRSLGGGHLCDGHGGYYQEFYWLTDLQRLCDYSGSTGPSTPTHIAPALAADYDGLFPARDAVLSEGEEGILLPEGSDAPYRYRLQDGTPLNDQSYQTALPFGHEALAVAQRDGRWCYLDRTGHEVTAPCYEGTYGYATQSSGQEPSTSSPLLNGFAAVCRDGKFGLLDSTGQERVPCTYAGLVWDGQTGWLRLEDGWHSFRLPDAVPPTIPDAPALPQEASRVPIEYAYPDVWDEAGATRTTTSEGTLNVRSGPGTGYDKVSDLAPGTAVTVLGRSSTVEGWVLVILPDGWPPVGWVSSEYLE